MIFSSLFVLTHTCLTATDSTLFPYTTLFRSRRVRRGGGPAGRRPAPGVAQRDQGVFHRVRLAPRGGARRHRGAGHQRGVRSEEHTSELQSRGHLVCRLLLEKKKNQRHTTTYS